jgi:hypothetical protein
MFELVQVLEMLRLFPNRDERQQPTEALFAARFEELRKECRSAGVTLESGA